jgi:hypothetical protein
LGTKYLVVLCAGSALLLAEDESTSVVNGALVGVSLGYQASPSVVLSALLLTDNPWFLTEGKDLPLCSSYFPLGVSQLSGHNHHQLHASHQALFWRRCRGRSGRPLQGEFFTRTSFTLFYCFALLYFYLHCFISKTQKN